MTADRSHVPLRSTRSAPVVFGAGAAIGLLGRLIGLGGAEFRLPLLISLFGFAALSAVILNKAMSLAVVLVALSARLGAVPAAEVAAAGADAVGDDVALAGTGEALEVVLGVPAVAQVVWQTAFNPAVAPVAVAPLAVLLAGYVSRSPR
ncbi:hypothetical protein [Streptomyces enissocaesilis]|uniref:Uncharacterized protein n=1 Tax=Streptomyces enissocaesilis TaxID=332589 RepID=A0ABN3XA51_9ACTN